MSGPVEAFQVGAVRVVRMNRPHRLNAVTVPVCQELRARIEEAGRDESCGAIVLTGAGRGFCAGADLQDQLETNPHPTREDIVSNFEDGYNPFIRSILNVEKPVINAINGVTAGAGVGIAFAGDIILAARAASFRLVFGPQLGVAPDFGASWWLARTAGRTRAIATLLTGDSISAARALEWGLVWQVVDDDALLAHAVELGERLASGAPSAFAQIRRLVDAAMVATPDGQLDNERDANARLCASRIFDEGVRAFVEKRKPVFAGLSSEPVR